MSSRFELSSASGSSGPAQVLEYLGRYTHRVAISNQRLLALDHTYVTFQWKDYRQPHQPKRMILAAEEFIRRFLLHALPPGFQRIHHYGLLANCRRKQSLVRCRQLLAAPVAALLPQPRDYKELYQTLTAQSLVRCPRCLTGVMVRIESLPAYRWPARPQDTS